MLAVTEAEISSKWEHREARFLVCMKHLREILGVLAPLPSYTYALHNHTHTDAHTQTIWFMFEDTVREGGIKGDAKIAMKMQSFAVGQSEIILQEGA